VSGKVEIHPYHEDMQETTKVERDSLYDFDIVFLRMPLDFTVGDANHVEEGISYLTFRFKKQYFLTV
jgi:hypothetical protein